MAPHRADQSSLRMLYLMLNIQTAVDLACDMGICVVSVIHWGHVQHWRK